MEASLNRVFWEKKFLYKSYMQHRDFSRTLATIKMQLTNFTKNPILGVTGLLDQPLLVEHVHFIEILFIYMVNPPIRALINSFS